MSTAKKFISRLRQTNPHLRWVTLMMIGSAILYYLPFVAGLFGWKSAQVPLNRLHDLYGLDIYTLFFFIPVVYIAHVSGVTRALLTALVSMFILLPYAVLMTPYPESALRPAAFVIILSAVGAVVSMLQRNDEQRRRSMNQLKCLYEVGKAVTASRSAEEFFRSVTEIIPRCMCSGSAVEIRLVLRDMEFKTPGLKESAGVLREYLSSGGEVLGSIEMYATGENLASVKQGDMLRTLAERIGGGIHEIELQLALEEHFELMEEEVEERTRDLEKAQEKLIRSERLAAVGELASGVGHELRNPLNVIKNCVYLLHMGLDGKGDADTLNSMRLLDRQVDIANRIITDLLDFTRVSPPSPDRIDLNSLVKESISWVTVPKNAAVQTNLVTGVTQVFIDAEQVGRAFANIISNAFQAMGGKESGELKVSTGVNGEYAWAAFEDNGCGIPEENLGKIFEPLFTTKPKGIGLGLAITKRLVEQNHGSIEVKSQVNTGTTFTLKLPVRNGS